ncbi:hypothetical protein SODALDRAFT_360313 [Sodiomyces alkalinus F11]|uniref:Uncharacterized protein n=1 Tax=Sodiomyces alkalinus (strain CBS 110278 / VKM F-3762 / F11) TaxID=1314773 RepID=A0A3N2PU18_SODAK|nr:hypothetical protein SODALDRAFT_360313 [Sodiomyces alkalinus F11]ROT37995.1 hypothetical protein SODALDRAFT_360313 [Sodiomyces alkalinus F11]
MLPFLNPFSGPDAYRCPPTEIREAQTVTPIRVIIGELRSDTSAKYLHRLLIYHLTYLHQPLSPPVLMCCIPAVRPFPLSLSLLIDHSELVPVPRCLTFRMPSPFPIPESGKAWSTFDYVLTIATQERIQHIRLCFNCFRNTQQINPELNSRGTRFHQAPHPSLAASPGFRHTTRGPSETDGVHVPRAPPIGARYIGAKWLRLMRVMDGGSRELPFWGSQIPSFESFVCWFGRRAHWLPKISDNIEPSTDSGDLLPPIVGGNQDIDTSMDCFSND